MVCPPAAPRLGPHVPDRRTVRAMDDVDRLLLEALRRNARATFAELGRLVGLSAPAVHDRVGKLESTGVVSGYHATIIPAALGLGVTALVGILLSEDGEADDVATAMQEIAEIEDCWFVAGGEAFLVKVRVPDVDALEATLGRLRRVRGISRTRTTVVLSTRWEGRIRSAAPPVELRSEAYEVPGE